MNVRIHDHTGGRSLTPEAACVPNHLLNPTGEFRLCFFCQVSGPGGLVLPLCSYGGFNL